MASEIADEGEFLLSITLEDRGLSPGGGFTEAQPKASYKIIRTKKGSRIELRLLMTEGGDMSKPHFVWHLLQFGIPPRRQPKTSPPVPIKPPRTIPNSLIVNRAPVQVERFAVIPKGTEIRRVPARNWYEEAVELLEEVIRGDYPGWELQSWKVNKP